MNPLSCEKEPIHILGRIQSHGFLLAFDPVTSQIKYVSKNLPDYTGIPVAGVLQKSFWEFLQHAGPEAGDEVGRLLQDNLEHDFHVKNYTSIRLNNGGDFYLAFSKSEGHVIAEFESIPAGNDTVAEDAGSFAQLLSFDSIDRAANFLCNEVARFSGFDRVMVYRFDPDYNGEVIAETSEGYNHSFLHHHFPASDIPAQARQLYLINRMRLIRDVDDGGSALLSDQDSPLDLTNSVLRAVSPVHIRYLKNMGVEASYSISIIYEGRLWGLVTCHNRSALHIPLHVRNFCKTITDIFAVNLGNLYAAATNREAEKYAAALTEATRHVILTGDQQGILNKKLNEATGGAFVKSNEVHTIGQVPAKETILAIAGVALQQDQDVFSTASIKQFLPGIPGDDQRVASGVLAITLSAGARELLLWFKPEVESTIQWAGNPEKHYQDFESMESLNPRTSFESWSQRFSGVSEGWNSGELRIAGTLAREILKINQERSDTIRQLHEKLQEAYDELSTFSYTVSHDLKTPLTVVKNYAELLVMKESLSATGELFTGKIISSANKMHTFINDLFAYTKIGFSNPVPEEVDVNELVQSIIDDCRVVYGDKFRASIDNLPAMRTDKTLLYQIFSNLISNAVKYSLNKGDAQIAVTCREQEDSVEFVVSDNGIGMPEGEIEHLFTRFYRLSNARTFEGTGLGLSITKRIIEKLSGNISITSREGNGTRCTFVLPKEAYKWQPAA